METELQQIAGLSEAAIAEYLKIFEKEGIDVDVLLMIESDNRNDMLVNAGIPVGAAVKILNHFRRKNVPSAPPGVVIPRCSVHPSQEIFALCMEDGEIVCRDCKSTLPHSHHDCEGSVGAVHYLRKQLSELHFDIDLSPDIQKQQQHVAHCTLQLREAEEKLIELQKQQQQQREGKEMVAQALRDTSTVNTEPHSLVALQQLHSIWVSLKDTFDPLRDTFLTRQHQLWVIKNVLKGKSAKLLYKADGSSFSPQQFHQQCDNKGATVTLIKQENNILMGGYASVSWDSHSAWTTADDSFLFTLVTPEGDNPQIHPLTQKQYALLCHSNYGPTFGYGYDLITHVPNGSAVMHTQLGTSYNANGLTKMVSTTDVPLTQLLCFQVD